MKNLSIGWPSSDYWLINSIWRCLVGIMSCWLFVLQTFCHVSNVLYDILFCQHFALWALHLMYILSYGHFVLRPFCLMDILSHGHFVLLIFCLVDILSCWYFVLKIFCRSTFYASYLKRQSASWIQESSKSSWRKKTVT